MMKKKIHNFVQSTGMLLFSCKAISITDSLLKNKRLMTAVVPHANINWEWKTWPNTGILGCDTTYPEDEGSSSAFVDVILT
jgi:hypothetical protein